MKSLLLTAVLATALTNHGACAHDEQHASDWIGERQLTDPDTKEPCCGIRDCHPIKFGGVRETASGYYVVELKRTMPSARVIWASPDSGWWLCAHWINVDSEEVTLEVRCLIGPPRSS